jgi:hypothetical protein
MSYGVPTNLTNDMYRLAGVYAGRILNGAEPGESPVMLPTRFELVINDRTAKALRIAVPRTVPLRDPSVSPTNATVRPAAAPGWQEFPHASSSARHMRPTDKARSASGPTSPKPGARFRPHERCGRVTDPAQGLTAADVRSGAEFRGCERNQD